MKAEEVYGVAASTDGALYTGGPAAINPAKNLKAPRFCLNLREGFTPNLSLNTLLAE